MRRPVLVVLLLTFVALVVATLWVPCTLFDHAVARWDGRFHWRWIGSVLWPPALDETGSAQTEELFLLDRLLVLEYALIIAIGGLLAGTFLTLLAVPVMFSVLHGLREKLLRRFEA